MNENRYDVIVIGSGHAGIEAALASSRFGCKTIVFTINIDSIGLMTCNPSIGGPAKGLAALKRMLEGKLGDGKFKHA